ncbi:MAG: anion permease [Micavibrio aeruginosavorus]|uniref:Anion permease n=1 Tax=Micavibrio aeruginosavorus TaxID=349221 RepID=A0A2W5N8Z3_9BACT|nr:MAG: anion permease [Micavibrio aeruginosavorus]
MDPLILLVAVVALTLVFDYTNGFHDAANAIATVVSTRVMRPTTAVIYGAVLNFAGALLGTEVAATIGKGLVDPEAITIITVLCTIIAAICWNLLTWWKGLPTSSSHALIGSLLGATFFSGDISWDSIHLDKVWEKVVLPMISSPLLGFFVGFILMTGLIRLVWRTKLPKINRRFGRLQIFSAGFMALSHGHNDAQKSMGIIALALLLTYPGESFEVPLWVILSCALAMGLGTLSGGWRIIRTMGSKMIKLQPIHGFAAETTASLIITGASHFGIPVSTTQVISSSILGVGATKRLSAVRWGVVGNIIWAWVLTLPLTFLFSGLLMLLIKTIAS